MATEVTADPTATAYTDVDTVDTVAETHPDGAGWRALTDDDQKDGILAQASRDVDMWPAVNGSEWMGDRATDDQELEWARTGTDYSDDAWPSAVVQATIEQALYVANRLLAGNPATPDASEGNIKRKVTGPLETEYFAPTETADTRFAWRVASLLRKLIVSTAAAGWGSAAVVRSS